MPQARNLLRADLQNRHALFVQERPDDPFIDTVLGQDTCCFHRPPRTNSTTAAARISPNKALDIKSGLKARASILYSVNPLVLSKLVTNLRMPV